MKAKHQLLVTCLDEEIVTNYQTSVISIETTFSDVDSSNQRINPILLKGPDDSGSRSSASPTSLSANSPGFVAFPSIGRSVGAVTSLQTPKQRNVFCKLDFEDNV